MFCNQCEQASKGFGCDVRSVCGKAPEVADLQDMLIHTLRGLSIVAVAAAEAGVTDAAVGPFTADALFTTLTNVDFDPVSVAAKIDEAARLRDSLKARAEAAGATVPTNDPAVTYAPAPTIEGKAAQRGEFGFVSDARRDEDVQSLQQTTIFGLKGVGAYAYHARELGQEDPEVYAFMHKALAAVSDQSIDLNGWVGLTLETGKVNYRVMELLDAGNTGRYGHPKPTKVPLGHRPGKAVLISGHDLGDLEALLKATQGTGVDVYTHGEMLPTHAYPELKDTYANFFGHYGTAWQNQHKEFAAFPGAILMTTNCLMPPKDEYKDRIFTTGPVQFPDVKHLERDQYAEVVARAQELPGFTDEVAGGEVLVGFGRNTVLGVAPQVIDAVKSGAIKHFFLVGGCDGAKPGRNYYTDFVEKSPKDTIVLTLACGKFRFFDKQIGEIGGIPRLLDVGQCNDAYSAIQIAVALADAFGVGVNDLPLSMILSWYEQKAVSILLTLLWLGIKDIRLGPTLPAFITPNVLQVLVDNFDIKPIGESAEADLAAILGEEVVA